MTLLREGRVTLLEEHRDVRVTSGTLWIDTVPCLPDAQMCCLKDIFVLKDLLLPRGWQTIPIVKFFWEPGGCPSCSPAWRHSQISQTSMWLRTILGIHSQCRDIFLISKSVSSFNAKQ